MFKRKVGKVGKEEQEKDGGKQKKMGEKSKSNLPFVIVNFFK